MSLLQASGLRKAFGAHDVLRGLDVSVPHQARIALVGPNGIGKSTLLMILAGLDQADAGQIQRASNLKIGFLPQEAKLSSRWAEASSQTLWEATVGAFAALREMEADLNILERRMADPRKAEGAIARYGQLQDAFERAGGYTYQAECRRVLRGLGFGQPQFDQPLRQLSGGERTRALLARLLLEDPDLLLLDEPTNHLDLDAIEWLENWLGGWPGAAVIVSHDRYFLDRTVETVWELSVTDLASYRGNYHAYLQQREARWARQTKEHRAQQAHVAAEQDFIRRNIAGQNTRQARGRRKRLERFLEEQAVEAPRAARRVSIRFGSTARSGEVVLRTEELAVGRGRQALFGVPDLVLRRGECAAVIGPNGAGKTTFLQTLLGRVSPMAGQVELGANVSIGYFAQAHGGLNPESTVLEALMAVDPALRIGSARDLLGRFGFTGDSVDKRVDALSGGERGRLALARLIQEGGNLLLLDEPTNHLDLTSQEVLESALSAFEGTILLVTHDRYLVDALATQVWSVQPEVGTLSVVHGGYQAFKAWRQEQLAAARETEPAAATKPPPEKPAGPPANLRVARIETRIEELEEALADLADQIEAAGGDREKVRELGERYSAVQEALQAELLEWERLSQRLEGA